MNEDRVILLVEDNLVNQKLARRLLEKGGHTVTCASDGIQALEAFEQARFDAVLMDIQMPEMDGIEATAALRRADSRSAIVILSIHDDMQTRTRVQAAGAVAFVEKRGATDSLLAAIRQAARHSYDTR